LSEKKEVYISAAEFFGWINTFTLAPSILLLSYALFRNAR
jgi:hypothetical protein